MVVPSMMIPMQIREAPLNLPAAASSIKGTRKAENLIDDAEREARKDKRRERERHARMRETEEERQARRKKRRAYDKEHEEKLQTESFQASSVRTCAMFM